MSSFSDILSKVSDYLYPKEKSPDVPANKGFCLIETKPLRNEACKFIWNSVYYLTDKMVQTVGSPVFPDTGTISNYFDCAKQNLTHYDLGSCENAVNATIATRLGYLVYAANQTAVSIQNGFCRIINNASHYCTPYWRNGTRTMIDYAKKHLGDPKHLTFPTFRFFMKNYACAGLSGNRADICLRSLMAGTSSALGTLTAAQDATSHNNPGAQSDSSTMLLAYLTVFGLSIIPFLLFWQRCKNAKPPQSGNSRAFGYGSL